MNEATQNGRAKTPHKRESKTHQQPTQTTTSDTHPKHNPTIARVTHNRTNTTGATAPDCFTKVSLSVKLKPYLETKWKCQRTELKPTY